MKHLVGTVMDSTRSLICHIVAASSNNVIGVQNTLPWDIPEDLKFFKTKTLGRPVIMGRKTYESLGKALPKRLNIVLSRQADFKLKDATVFTHIEDAIKLAQEHGEGKEIFIIGGGHIYLQSITLVDRIYLTRIHKDFEGDAFYPTIPSEHFTLSKQVDRDGDPAYSFFTYDKKIHSDSI